MNPLVNSITKPAPKDLANAYREYARLLARGDVNDRDALMKLQGELDISDLLMNEHAAAVEAVRDNANRVRQLTLTAEQAEAEGKQITGLQADMARLRNELDEKLQQHATIVRGMSSRERVISDSKAEMNRLRHAHPEAFGQAPPAPPVQRTHFMGGYAAAAAASR